jgi:cephalosporin hydroxylase
MKRALIGARRFAPLYRRTVGRVVRRLFLIDLIEKTDNFAYVKWLGSPIWQNVLDLWVIQEAISELRPALLIECGTNRGGSALFYANLFDLMNHGRVITIDIECMHDLDHPRIEFIEGSSTDPRVIERVRADAAEDNGPVMVILDSNHSESHVAAELEAYSPLVTLGSLLHVQDGVIDQLTILRYDRPGPLPAIKRFLARHPEFVWERERSERFLITHHPMGWLLRIRDSCTPAEPALVSARPTSPR